MCMVNNFNLLILLLSNYKEASLQLYENGNIMRLKIAAQRLPQDSSYIIFQTKKSENHCLMRIPASYLWCPFSCQGLITCGRFMCPKYGITIFPTTHGDSLCYNHPIHIIWHSNAKLKGIYYYVCITINISIVDFFIKFTIRNQPIVVIVYYYKRIQGRSNKNSPWLCCDRVTK